MVQIKTFQIILEKFQSSCSAYDDSAEEGIRIYVQFSFDEVEILIAGDSNLAMNSQSNIRPTKLREENFQVTSSEDGRMLNAPEGTDARTNKFACSFLFIVRNCKVPTLRKLKEELSYLCAIEVKVIGMNSSFISSGTSQHQQSSCSFLAEFILQKRNVTLRLANKTLFWSQVLRQGCFYIITERVTDEGSSRILTGGNLKPVIEVDSKMSLTRVCFCSQCRVTPPRVADNTEFLQALEEARKWFANGEEMHCVDDVLSVETCEKGERNHSVQRRYRNTFSR